MLTHTFGRTAKNVSAIGMGTWTMGSMWGPRNDAEALKSLQRALDLGITFIDTAAVYGDGHSEELIGNILKKNRHEVFVATKVPPKNFQWPARHHVPVAEAFTAGHIISETEKSLIHLKRDFVDLQQLHVWSDTWLNDLSWLEGIEKLKQSGKIKYFGVSINDHEPDSALKIIDSGLIDSVQVIYNIFAQEAQEKLFPLCLQKNIAVIARVPFDEGSLTGTLNANTVFHKKDWRKYYFTPDRLLEVEGRIEKLKKFLDEETPTLPLLALKFCLHHPAVSTVIPGMRTSAHVESNVLAENSAPLSEQILHELKAHAWIRNFYPAHG